ncbi:GH25 family lysozyme [Frondihabitans cladoniiphilus]|uniref:GH25 family lysozyme n=1 Tax=Frondihabitans cladoniiphilus TaxID=715785 RepID=A0ABP8VZL7_9MICO
MTQFRPRRAVASLGALVAAAAFALGGVSSTTLGAHGGPAARAAALATAQIKSEPGGASPTIVAPTVGVPGIDVSAYQHGVDWTKVRAAGARFAYIKATEGVTYTNARLVEQYTGAARAGLVRGAFHFAKPNVSTGQAQAEFFVAAMASLGGARVDGATTLPALLDLEYDPYTASDGTDKCWGLTPDQMVTWIASFSDTIVAFTGRLPVLYTTTNWWMRCTADSTAFSSNPLYLARYVTDARSGPGALPAAWKHYTIWQYTNVGSRYALVTDGSPGDTAASDEDVFRGSVAELRALARSTFRASIGLTLPMVGVEPQ